MSIRGAEMGAEKNGEIWQRGTNDMELKGHVRVKLDRGASLPGGR